MLLIQAVFVLSLAPAPVGGAEDEIVIASDETVVWEDGSQNLTGKVEVFGTLTVRNYEFLFNFETDGAASIWVMEGGLLEFDNVSLLLGTDIDNGTAYFLIKVEGRFVARDSILEHLTGQFIVGGGIRCVNGEVELYNTIVRDCEVQGVYVEGDDGSALLDNCNLSNLQYGVHAKDGATVIIRNGTKITDFKPATPTDTKRAGILVNLAEADVSNSTIFGIRDGTTQGIAARGSQLTVTDTVIHEIHNEGIELADDASGNIRNVEIYDCTVGIRVSDSSADVWSCNIYDNLDGMNVFQSDPIIRSTHLVNNINGLASKDCVPGYKLEDCTIGGNEQLGIYSVGKGLTETGTTWTNDQGEANGDARILQIWLLDINVSDHDGIPVAAAAIDIAVSNGTSVFDGTTNALGSVQEIELEGHTIENDGSTTEPGDYRIHIEKGVREANKKITLDKNKVLQVALGKVEKVENNTLWWLVLLLVIVAACGAFSYWWIRIR
jgi:hypothetical protein